MAKKHSNDEVLTQRVDAASFLAWITPDIANEAEHVQDAFEDDEDGMPTVEEYLDGLRTLIDEMLAGQRGGLAPVPTVNA